MTTVGWGAAVLVFTWWATGLRPFTGVAYAAVVGAGLATMLWGRRHRRPPVRSWPAGGLVVWASLGLALVAWQVAAFVQHPRYQHPTLSSLADVVLEPRAVRAVAVALWLVAAARLARSGPRAEADGP